MEPGTKDKNTETEGLPGDWDELNVEEVESRPKGIDSDVDKWKEKAAAWWDKTNRDIDRQTKDLRDEFYRMTDHSPAAWVQLRAALEKAYAELESGFKRAMTELKS